MATVDTKCKPFIGGDEKSKLEKFSNAVNSVVDKEVDEIIADALKTKEQIIETVSKEYSNLSYRKIISNVKVTEIKYVKNIAKSEYDSKTNLLRKREELTNKVFDNIRKKLIDFTTTPQYFSYLSKILSREKLTDGIIIQLKDTDMNFAEEFKKEYDADIRFVCEERIEIGGLSILNLKDNTLNDFTLDTAVHEEIVNFNRRGHFPLS